MRWKEWDISDFLGRPWWLQVKMRFCLHRYVEHEENSAKRKCEKCGRVEWLFSNPYPRIGEPKYFWKEMF